MKQSQGIIYTSDPDALELLKEKLQRLEDRKMIMIYANRLAKSGDETGLLRILEPGLVSKLLTPDVFGKLGFPDYSLARIKADIRRVKKRLNQINEIKNREPSIEMVNDIRILEDIESMRIRLYFPRKPSMDIINTLKSHGFHWSPRQRAWQRLISREAKYWAYKIGHSCEMI
jgi:hypothetical protein